MPKEKIIPYIGSREVSVKRFSDAVKAEKVKNYNRFDLSKFTKVLEALGIAVGTTLEDSASAEFREFDNDIVGVIVNKSKLLKVINNANYDRVENVHNQVPVSEEVSDLV